MSLSKQTIQRLRIVKRAVLAQPEMYNQNNYDEDWHRRKSRTLEARPFCETPACLAGWAAFLSEPDKPSFSTDEIRILAREWLGLSQDQATDLFVEWPDRGIAWKQPHSIAAAQDAAEHIERFIRNGGEWGEA